MRSLAHVLAALLVVSGAARTWRAADRSAGIDFYHYWVVAKVVARGDVPSIYSDDSRAALGQEFLHYAMAGGSPRQQAAAQVRRVLEPTSTPFLYTVLSPLGRLGYDAGLTAHLGLSLAALLAGIFVYGRVLGYETLPLLLLMALATFAFQPVQADLRVGNVSQMQLGMLALYAWLAARERAGMQAAAGAVLGAAVAFKPNLAAIPPLLVAAWALHGRWRRLARQGGGMAAGAAAAVLAGAVFFGSFGAWTDWATLVGEGHLATMPVDYGNVAPAAVAERWLGLKPGLLPGALAAVGVAAALVVRRRSRLEPPDDLALVAAGCLAFLVASLLVWQHYLILALPAVLLLLRPRAAGPAWPALLAFVAIAIDPYADLFGVAAPARQAPVVVAGLVLLCVLVLREVAVSVSRSEPGRAAGRDVGAGAPAHEAL